MRLRLLLLVSVLLAPLAGCGVFGPDPEDTATAFLQALARGDAGAAGALTDDPRAATERIRQVHGELEAQRVALTLDRTEEADDERSATATFTANWQLAQRGQWRYQGSLDLVRADTETGWAVRWSPSVLHPRLGGQQTLALREQRPDPAPVVGRDGAALLSAQRVIPVVVAPGRAPAVAGPLAAALHRFDESITEQSIVQGAADAPEGQPYTVAVLREADYESVRERIYELPGVTFPAQRRLLPPDGGFATRVLRGVRDELQQRLAGETGWRIVTVDPLGTEVATLASRPARPAPSVTVSLSRRLQAVAADALAPLDRQAMLVALQPSSGDVLAVAQNAAADAAGPLALMGRYPPGSTFKIVTAAAALQSGELTPGSPVDCPPTTTINGRVVPNIDHFGLGTVPFRTAFARSCNTTFSQLAAGFAPETLTGTARQFGIGADYDITGMTTLTGEVPPARDAVTRAANGFGQGKVLTTPFGMAMVPATVAAGGKAPTPQLIRGVPTGVNEPAGRPLAPAAADGLPGMMRQVVTEGTATALRGLGDVHGKTGTAEHGSGAHGWFVGYRDDLAFAVLVVDAGSSEPAVAAAGRFLAAADPE